MQTVHQTLRETDEAVLAAIAAAWGIDPPPTDQTELIDALTEIMLDEDAAARMWETLDEQQRQALQTVLGSNGGRMPMAQFKRFFGDIRQMGRGAIEREQPYKNPQSTAEALYYNGFIAQSFQLSDSGSRAFAYVPEDLILTLPTHQTGYDDLEAPEQDPLNALDAGEINRTRRADTAIVDDMTTLLAYLQLHAPAVEGDTLVEDERRRLLPHLLTKRENRIVFMLAIGISADLIEVQNGRAYPRRADARSWLGAARSEQIETLIRAWLEAPLYRELWYVPGLTVEQAETYDPTLGRRAVLDALKEAVPESDWFDLDQFAYIVKQTNPDFQRPNGDYDTWYIQDMAEEYVNGFESWDIVEAGLIEFIISGPMHWLGLVDVAPEAARLTAYGRGVVGMTDFPKPPDQPEDIVVEEDGTLLVSRKVTRLDHFQVMRITTWQDAPDPGSGDPFVYTLDIDGVRRADAQDINTGHISAFLGRVLGDDPIPERIERLLRAFQSGDAANITLEEMIVLRTTSEQVMDDLLGTPELRRYLGARLGPMACAVRADQWQELDAALTEFGMSAEVKI